MTQSSSTGPLCDTCLTVISSTQGTRREVGANLNIVNHPDLPGEAVIPWWVYHSTCSSLPMTSS